MQKRSSVYLSVADNVVYQSLYGERDPNIEAKPPKNVITRQKKNS